MSVYKKTNKKASKAFSGKYKSSLVDENYFLRINSFKLKIKFYAQDLYFLLSEHFTDSEIAREMARQFGGSYEKYIQYINNTLFSSCDQTILATKIPLGDLRMYRYWWKIERRLKRRGATICKMLDKRAGIL